MALTATEEAQLRQLIDQEAALLSLASSEATIISKLGATKVTLADLTSASVINDADLFLIRQGTTEKSVAGSVVKSLGNQPDASETVKGIIELATVAEVQTGTDTTRAVTTAGLVGRTATETRTGVIELATAAEAQALTDAVRALSPAGLASAFGGSNQSLAASGYQKLPSGLIIQWGTVIQTSAQNVAVTFPISFPTAIFNSLASSANNTGTANGASTYGQSTSGMAVALNANYSFTWMAIGK